MTAQTFAHESVVKKSPNLKKHSKTLNDNKGPEYNDFSRSQNQIYDQFLPKSTEIERFNVISENKKNKYIGKKQDGQNVYSSGINTENVTKRSQNQQVHSSRVYKTANKEYDLEADQERAQEYRYSEGIDNTSRPSSQFSEFVPNEEMKSFYRKEFSQNNPQNVNDSERDMMKTFSNSKEASNSMASSKITYGMRASRNGNFGFNQSGVK